MPLMVVREVQPSNQPKHLVGRISLNDLSNTTVLIDDACEFQDGELETSGMSYTVIPPPVGISPYMNVKVLSASVYTTYAPLGLVSEPFMEKYPSVVA